MFKAVLVEIVFLSKLLYTVISRPTWAIMEDSGSSTPGGRHFFLSLDPKNATKLLFVRYLLLLV
jgi:hypothetical protein